MTYLQIVNSVLRRLRETEVSSVSDNAYSKMIGEFVNDAKRTVEDSFNWNALSDTLTATTTADVFNYVLVGSGQRFRVVDVINDTSNLYLREAPNSWMNQQFLINTPAKSTPEYYNFNGVDSNGDTQVDLYPIPNNTYNIRFNLILPQAALSADADILKIPSEPVVFLAFAKALVERGEDGGMGSSEAYALYKQSLSDAVALEANRYSEDTQWYSI